MKSRNDTCTFLLSSIQSWYVVLVIFTGLNLDLSLFAGYSNEFQILLLQCLSNKIILTFWKPASDKQLRLVVSYEWFVIKSLTLISKFVV